MLYVLNSERNITNTGKDVAMNLLTDYTFNCMCTGTPMAESSMPFIYHKYFTDRLNYHKTTS